MKIKQSQLENNLAQFTGTTAYHRILPIVVVTDGVKYLIEHAECHWLTQLFGLHLIDVDFNDNAFTVCKLQRRGRRAKAVIEDGNGVALAWQGVDWTDFPLTSITLYAVWSEHYWVLMLPSEY